MAKAQPKKIAKKIVAKKTAAKTTKKTSVKKVAKKAAAKKAPVKKNSARKVLAKKIVKKLPVKKAAVKKVVAKKAPAKKPVAKAVVKPAAKKLPVAKVAVAKRPAPKSNRKVPVVFPVQTAKEQKALYKVGNYVVYPTHGVGKIIAEETQMIGDIELRLLVINFEKDKMTLRVPMQRASAAGLRPISGSDKMKEVYASLKSKAKISRGMWSRRAQEYETKINSGNIILISEVVRDLHQNVDQSERSYSERMIYENALGRLVGEVAAAEGTDTKAAYDKLMKLLRAKVAAAAALKEAA
ncbi:MAG: CarD family transcriptional regulator [Alphaproteobacteria bacterium]|nr:CarD family transcriptional regulator [Alphaproteobacteria bacterium]